MAQTEPHLFNEDALDLNNVTNTNLIPKIIGSKFFKIIFSFLLHNAFTTPSQRLHNGLGACLGTCRILTSHQNVLAVLVSLRG